MDARPSSFRRAARALTALAALAAAAALGSCGMGGSGNGDLTQDVGAEVGDYEIVDLTNGSLQSAQSIPDLLTNPAYKSTLMVFKALPAGSCPGGQAPGTFGAQVDEPPVTLTVSRFYIGVFDVTQAQWQQMAGANSQPWTDPGAQGVAGAASINAGKPAFNLSRDGVLAAIASAQARYSLPASLPTGVQWEYACRAGASTVYFWGDLGATPSASAQPFALVNETSGGAPGPIAVGSLSPNAFGLYDMLGNVWQWTADGSGVIRGGSWRDSLAQARCANAMALDHTLAHVLVGARLVLTP
jgi:formylglycine-generating enzyme required for sulfatase activity